MGATPKYDGSLVIRALRINMKYIKKQLVKN